MRLGFLGLGHLGLPMALNLARKFPLTAWNRSASKYPAIIQAGAAIAASPAQVADQSDVLFTMLFDEGAIRSILTDDFRRALRHKTLVNTSSVSVDFSRYLNELVRAAGGTFIEMPVSGSKIPAQQGSLVGMTAGDREAIEHIRPLLEPMTRDAIYCGSIGAGLKMKYAINAFLIITTVGLAEATNLARAQGLDLAALGSVLEAGPLASAYSKLKVSKLMEADWSAQASIDDCYNSTQLIQAAAEETGTQTPLVRLCSSLYADAKAAGVGNEDMIAVVKMLQASNEGALDKAST